MTEKRILKTVAAKAVIIAVATYGASSGICLAQGGSPQSAPSTTQNVNVVNTPSVNVGTMPAVSITGTPTVNVASIPAVSITGTPTVSLAGTPTVNANLPNPALIKDLDNPARQAVQHMAFLKAPATYGIAQEGISPSSMTPYEVPAGKRLVIDSISQQTNFSIGDASVVVVLDIPVSAELAQFRLAVPVSQSVPVSSTQNLNVGNARVQAYADAGTKVACFLNRMHDGLWSGEATSYCYWSGHLVDLP